MWEINNPKVYETNTVWNLLLRSAWRGLDRARDDTWRRWGLKALLFTFIALCKGIQALNPESWTHGFHRNGSRILDSILWISDSTLLIPDSKASHLLDSGFLHIERRLAVNRKLTQGQRCRQGERRLKILFRVIVIISLQPQVVRNGKCVWNLQEWNCHELFGCVGRKCINVSFGSHVLYTTWKLVH